MAAKRERDDAVVLDGAQGEGGGQILRSAASLSAITGRPLRIFNIRAGRPNPGLQRQHLVALEAAREVSGATLEGGAVGSTEITFTPPAAGAAPPLRAAYAFDIGSAGSTALVFQTLLPVLLARLARGSGAAVALTIRGGTHNPMAPSAAFLEGVLAPALRAAGAGVDVACARAGFYPAGGGELRATVRALPRAPLPPAPRLLAGGAVTAFRGTVLATAALPAHVAAREAAALAAALALPPSAVAVERPPAKGPGNAVLVAVERGAALGELVCVCGERGVAAEAVAGAAAAAARALAASAAPFSEHAADQLLLPLLVMGGGAFRAVALGRDSKHFATNVGVLDAFVGGGGGGGGGSCVRTEPAVAGEGDGGLDPGVVVTVAAVRLAGADAGGEAAAAEEKRGGGEAPEEAGAGGAGGPVEKGGGGGSGGGGELSLHAPAAP
jgi:RNA 3'-terminal phosphate cyclase (ATP)